MQDMKDELEAEGMPINVAVINIIGAESSQSGLTASTSYPVFQDVSSVGAWDLHDGGKDDIYIYGSDGLLHSYMPMGGSLSISLSSTTGYTNVKSAIVAAHSQ